MKRFTLAIPTTINTALNNAKFIQRADVRTVEGLTMKAAKFITLTLGGVTVTKGLGLWEDNGRIVVEQVFRVESIVFDAADNEKADALFRRIAKDIGEMFRQDCVLVTTDEVSATLI